MQGDHREKQSKQ